MDLYCSYYQANVNKPDTGFLTATLRSFEHLCFDRSLNKDTFLFEFFVPAAQEYFFLEVMHFYEQKGVITNLQKLPNRLLNQNAEL